MEVISELQKQVLREAYPNLSFSDDLDIERYFELRKAGQLNTALSIYDNKLKKRYPDDKKRIQLMSFYRTKDPRFYVLLTENLNILAEKTINNIKKVIIYITDRMSAINSNDVFSLIRTVENLISQIKADRFAIIAECEKYARFAGTLDFRRDEMKQASEIIRMYVTDTISSVNAYRSKQARLKQKELENKKQQSRIQIFDFSQIHFTDEQVAEIVLPSEALRPEDKVIAYIIKYWDKVFDNTFQNTILLYSRKYKTQHHDIYNSIKIARLRSWQDSELLQSVLSTVVTGYYYSISGDLYLNHQWQQIKPILSSGNKVNWTPPESTTSESKSSIYDDSKDTILKRKALPQTSKVLNNTRSKIRTKQNRKSRITKQTKDTNIERVDISPAKTYKYTHSNQSSKNWQVQKPVGLLITAEQLRAEQKKQIEMYELMKAEEKKYYKNSPANFRENAKKQEEKEKAFLDKQRLEAKYKRNTEKTETLLVRKTTLQPTTTQNTKSKNIETTVIKEKPHTNKKSTSQKTSIKKTRTTIKRKQKKEQPPKSKSNIFVPRKNNNFDPTKTRSIEQMIKEETGKSYVIYKDLFFKDVRTSIRHVLEATSMHKRSLFKTEQNTAENIIYIFLERNYKNLYQQWETSNARDEVYALGFNVKSLVPIIKHWANKVRQNKFF